LSIAGPSGHAVTGRRMPTEERSRTVLVIGYGNELRADDGVGRAIAERVAEDERALDARVISVRQLTPDLALDVSQASFVVFVDAAADLPPGEVSVRRVSPDAAAGAFSHHVSAGGLPGLARELYGHSPETVSVSVGLASTALVEGLSPEVEAAVPAAAEAVLKLVAGSQPDAPGGDRHA
jgi:hydrogenase maturation protease